MTVPRGNPRRQVLSNFSPLDPRKITFSTTVNFQAGRPALLVQRPMFASGAFFSDFAHGDKECSHPCCRSAHLPYFGIPFSAAFSNAEFNPFSKPSTTVRSTLETIVISTGDHRIVYQTNDLLEAPNWSNDGAALYFNGGGLINRPQCHARRQSAHPGEERVSPDRSPKVYDDEHLHVLICPGSAGLRPAFRNRAGETPTLQP